MRGKAEARRAASASRECLAIRGGAVGRRRFLASASGAALGAATALGFPSVLRAQAGAAANRVRLAILGFGARGAQLARAVRGAFGAEVVAVADLYAGRLRRAREVLGEAVAAEREHRRLLDRKDVDAVLIATPDHAHAPLSQEALSAGKDVYCESPVTHTAGERAVLEKAVRETGRVFQAGAACATSPLHVAAREVVRSGRLGRIVVARGVWDSAGALAAWQTPFPPDASPETIDFTAFLGAAPRQPFDPYRFFRWRRYWDYGTGLAGERFTNQLTALHWLLGEATPGRVTASGAVRLWRDGREVPDTLVAAIEYPNLSVSLSATQAGGKPARELRLVGSEATLVIDAEGFSIFPEPLTEPYPDVGDTWPKEHRDWFYMMHSMTPDGRVRGNPPLLKAAERYALPDELGLPSAHLSDFVAAVRTRAEPTEPLAAGLAAADVVHRINAAWKESARA